MQDEIIEKPELKILTLPNNSIPKNMSFIAISEMPVDMVGIIKPIRTSNAYELIFNDELDPDTQTFTKAYLVALCLLLEPVENTPVYRSKHFLAQISGSVERKAFNDAIKAMYPNGAPINHVAAIARVCRLADMEVFTRLKRIKAIK